MGLLEPHANEETASEGDEEKLTMGLVSPAGVFPMGLTTCERGEVEECGCFSLELSLLTLEAEEGAKEDGEEGGDSRLTMSRREAGSGRGWWAKRWGGEGRYNVLWSGKWEMGK